MFAYYFVTLLIFASSGMEIVLLKFTSKIGSAGSFFVSHLLLLLWYPAFFVTFSQHTSLVLISVSVLMFFVSEIKYYYSSAYVFLASGVKCLLSILCVYWNVTYLVMN